MKSQEEIKEEEVEAEAEPVHSQNDDEAPNIAAEMAANVDDDAVEANE